MTTFSFHRDNIDHQCQQCDKPATTHVSGRGFLCSLHVQPLLDAVFRQARTTSKPPDQSDLKDHHAP